MVTGSQLVLFDHFARVGAVLCSPVHPLLVTAGSDGQVLAWSSSLWEVMRVMEEPGRQEVSSNPTLTRKRTPTAATHPAPREKQSPSLGWYPAPFRDACSHPFRFLRTLPSGQGEMRPQYHFRIGIVGTKGCGKTTFLQRIFHNAPHGQTHPTRGTLGLEKYHGFLQFLIPRVVDSSLCASAEELQEAANLPPQELLVEVTVLDSQGITPHSCLTGNWLRRLHGILFFVDAGDCVTLDPVNRRAKIHQDLQQVVHAARQGGHTLPYNTVMDTVVFQRADLFDASSSTSLHKKHLGQELLTLCDKLHLGHRLGASSWSGDLGTSPSAVLAEFVERLAVNSDLFTGPAWHAAPMGSTDSLSVVPDALSMEQSTSHSSSHCC